MITANRPSDGNPSRIREEFVASGDAMAALAERTAQVDQLVLEAASTLLLPVGPLRDRRAGRGRLRQAAAVSVFRYRRAAALPLRAAGAGEQGRDLGLPAAPLGCRPAHEPLGAHARRMLRGARRKYRAQRQPAGSAIPHRRPRALCRAGRPAAALRPRQSRRAGAQPGAADARTPRQVRRHVLSPGTERQGHARRTARLPAGLLARSDPRRRRRSRRPNCATPSAFWRGCAAICTA